MQKLSTNQSPDVSKVASGKHAQNKFTYKLKNDSKFASAMADWLKIGFNTLIGYLVFIHISKKDHCTSLITNATGCILVLGVCNFFFLFDYKGIISYFVYL